MEKVLRKLSPMPSLLWISVSPSGPGQAGSGESEPQCDLWSLRALPTHRLLPTQRCFGAFLGVAGNFWFSGLWQESPLVPLTWGLPGRLTWSCSHLYLLLTNTRAMWGQSGQREGQRSPQTRVLTTSLLGRHPCPCPPQFRGRTRGSSGSSGPSSHVRRAGVAKENLNVLFLPAARLRTSARGRK